LSTVSEKKRWTYTHRERVPSSDLRKDIQGRKGYKCGRREENMTLLSKGTAKWSATHSYEANGTKGSHMGRGGKSTFKDEVYDVSENTVSSSH